jgi:hypothetical protein
MTELQAALFAIQILFYLVFGTVIILTYQNAKKGLLSPVHTEYQKHVIERLKELSQELDTEFDPKSQNYWVADTEPLREQVDQINEEFSEKREEILARGEWEPYTHGHSRRYHETNYLARSIKADPFIPSVIRESTTEMLTVRAKALYEAEEVALNSYRQALAKGMPVDPRHGNYPTVNNTVVGILHQKGFNVDQVEEKVEMIRLAIQEYLDSFAPHR